MKRIVSIIVILLALAFPSGSLADSTFTKITTGPASVANAGAAAWGDFNNDGWLDIYITGANSSGPSYLFTNNGNGTFTRITSSVTIQNAGYSWGCTWGDYDNDGWLDLLKGLETGNARLYRNLSGVFTNATSSTIGTIPQGTMNVVWGDYDNDGNLDMFLAAIAPGSQGILLHNTGNGTFQQVSGLPLLKPFDCNGASWGDYDNDGRLDLAVTRFRLSGIAGSNMLFHNEGNGTFRAMTNSPVFQGPDGNSVCWGDYDNDGYLDLFVGRNGNRCMLYHNNGNGTFTQVTNGPMVTNVSASVGAAWADYDNDGYLDLFIANNNSAHNLLYHNNGDGTFTQITNGIIVNDYSYGQAVAWGDYDNDGFPDLFVSNYGAANFLYHNDGNSNNWITVKCEGRISNRVAIGAKVRVKATIGGREMWQLREISGGTGIGGQNDLRAQFGLGDATNVNVIRIEWPSGIVQELQNVAAKQILTVREPSKLSGSLTNGIFGLGLQGGKGIVYRIDSSEDLAAWSPWTILTNSSSPTNLTVPVTVPAQFFRAVEE